MCVCSESVLSIYHYLLDMGQLQKKKGTSFIFFNCWLFSCQYVGMSTVVLSIYSFTLSVVLVTRDQHHSDNIKWETPEITIHKINY